MVSNHCAYSKTAGILEAGDSRHAELNASAFMFPTLAITLMCQIPVPQFGSSSTAFFFSFCLYPTTTTILHLFLFLLVTSEKSGD